MQVTPAEIEPTLDWHDWNGKLFLTLRGGWDDAFAEKLHGKSFDGLELGGGEWGRFEFLELFADKVKHLSVVGYYGSLEGVERLRQLESLSLPPDGTPKKPPDISAFSGLKGCVLSWHRSYADAIVSLRDLRSVAIYGYSGTDCSTFAGLGSLESLSLIKGKLVTLDGLESLRALRRVELAYLRALEDISAIRSASLQYLWIENAPRLHSLQSVYALHDLSTLYLYECGELEESAWIARMESIKTLWIPVPLRAPVDWKAVLSLPAIEKLTIRPKSGDVITDDEIAAIIAHTNRRAREIARVGTKKSPIIRVEWETEEVKKGGAHNSMSASD